MTWRGKQQKEWSDKFMLEIKEILGVQFILTSNELQDMQENTDLLYCKDLKFTCRTRKYSDYLKYKDEITIRSRVPSGAMTELEKIVSGYGDIFFYSFSNEQETHLIKWIIGDISKLRLYLHKKFWECRNPFTEISNHDGTKLLAIKYNEIPGFVIKEWEQ